MDSAAIEKKVEELIEDGQPFTAWNVTRRMGPGFPHYQVKKVVHAMFNGGRMGSYNQNLVQIPGTDTEAFMYSPDGADPKDQAIISAVFGNGGPVAKQPVSVTGTSQALPAPKSSAAKQVKSSRPKTIKNADGSIVKDIGQLPGSALYIPQSMAQTIGVGPNGAAVCTSSTDKILISKPSIAPGMAKKINADSNGNIRIGKTALMKVGMDGRVQIKLDGASIQVSKA